MVLMDGKFASNQNEGKSTNSVNGAVVSAMVRMLY
ncbi:variable large family protein [Borrelia persica]|nr:variable large family protein [Borrelia persica]